MDINTFSLYSSNIIPALLKFISSFPAKYVHPLLLSYFNQALSSSAVVLQMRHLLIPIAIFPFSLTVLLTLLTSLLDFEFLLLQAKVFFTPAIFSIFLHVQFLKASSNFHSSPRESTFSFHSTQISIISIFSLYFCFPLYISFVSALPKYLYRYCYA